MKKPTIGITSYTYRHPRGLYSRVFADYSRSVINAGGIPFLLPQVENPDLAEEYLSRIDGLLLSGGEDILPLYYGEQPIREVQQMNPDRDEWEIALTRKAVEADLPVFGICRGIQVLNVALGGSLYQHVNSQNQTNNAHMVTSTAMCHLVHSVTIEPGTLLAACFKNSEILVNSFHNQSVKDLGAGLTVSARSADGLVEGIEYPEKRYVMGVQWHPEALTEKYPLFLKLFEAHVDASRGIQDKK
jgi:putative glutamine amidotransferase